MLMDAQRRGTLGMRNERVADLASEHVAGASGGRWSFGILIVSGGRRGCFEAGLAVPVDPPGYGALGLPPGRGIALPSGACRRCEILGENQGKNVAAPRCRPPNAQNEGLPRNRLPMLRTSATYIFLAPLRWAARLGRRTSSP